jgi:hypothetical protein
MNLLDVPNYLQAAAHFSDLDQTGAELASKTGCHSARSIREALRGSSVYVPIPNILNAILHREAFYNKSIHAELGRHLIPVISPLVLSYLNP